MNETMILTKPLIVMFEHDDHVICHLWPREKDTYAGYGLLIADLIRHAADYFSVEPEAILDWVAREINKSSTDIVRPS